MTKTSRQLRIGIDASAMIIRHKHGYENYVQSLLHAMAGLGSELEDLQLYFYFNAGNPLADPEELDEILPRFSRFVCRVYRPHHMYGRLLPLFAWYDRLDWLHLPVYLWSKRFPCPVGITIHDTCGARLARQPTLDLVQHTGSVHMHDMEVRQLVAAGSAYLTVSQAAANDVSEFYGVPTEKIFVVHHGVDPFFLPSPSDAARIKERYQLDRFILDVNVLQVRKNHLRLFEAFALARVQAGIPHHLVLVGRKGWGAEDILAAVGAFGLQDCIHYLDYVSREDLRGLYSGADLVVNPSICEGFGLPILEAMACGTPVAASEVSAFPEVGSDAVLYFDPLQVQSIAHRMVEGLTNGPLRDRLKLQGMERTALFTWEHAAHQTLSAYRIWCGAPPADLR